MMEGAKRKTTKREGPRAERTEADKDAFPLLHITFHPTSRQIRTSGKREERSNLRWKLPTHSAGRTTLVQSTSRKSKTSIQSVYIVGIVTPYSAFITVTHWYHEMAIRSFAPHPKAWNVLIALCRR